MKYLRRGGGGGGGGNIMKNGLFSIDIIMIIQISRCSPDFSFAREHPLRNTTVKRLRMRELLGS